MSRSKAKESFTVSEFKKQMDGVYTTSVNKDTLDECPMALQTATFCGHQGRISRPVRAILNGQF